MATNYFAPLQSAMSGATQNALLANQIRQQRAQQQNQMAQQQQLQQARQNAFTNPDLVAGMRTLGAAGDIQGLGALSNIGTAQKQQFQTEQERMEQAATYARRIAAAPEEMQPQLYEMANQQLGATDAPPWEAGGRERIQRIATLSTPLPGQGVTAGTSSYQPIVLEKPGTDERMLVSPIVDRGAGTTRLAPFEIPEGFQLTTETPGEKSTRKIEEKRKTLREEISATREKEMEKVVGKETAERLSGQVDTAYEAVDAIPIILSSIDLLDTVETGGIDAALVKGKQILGIESADEAELAQNLGKAVLKQLKPTFGAQFTVAEGRELKGIEAGWGKSSAGNKRLLQNALRIYKKGINRGMRAARRTGDMETYNELSQSLQQINQAESQKQTVDISRMSNEELLRALGAR